MAQKGTVDFRYDIDHDIVIARPRWTLDTSAEVMRWYQLHAAYFGGRFSSPKALVTINDEFDIAPPIAALWGSYRAKLHEGLVSVSFSVKNNPRVRLTTQTSDVRNSLRTREVATLEEAIQDILALRAGQEVDAPLSIRPSSMRMPAVGPSLSRDQNSKK